VTATTSHRLHHCRRDAAAWDAAVLANPNADVSFLSGYTALFDWYGDGEGWLLQSGEGAEAVFYPFLLRAIPGTDRTDLISPYGYTGPLGDVAHRDRFRRDLAAFCRDRGVVSQFVRLHPLLSNAAYFDHEVDPARRRTTVVVDLRGPEADAWAAMTPPCRRRIKQARRAGVVVEQTDDTEAFVHLYARSMERIGARSWYRFPPSFFQKARELLGAHLRVYLARDGGCPVGGVAGLHLGERAYYFLAAAERHPAPPGIAELLIWELIQDYRALGCRSLVLGTGNLEGDSLYRFKAKFGPGRATYDQACVIEDMETYTRLRGGTSVRDGFFPAYRSPDAVPLSRVPA
jgi:hypothetical protein